MSGILIAAMLLVVVLVVWLALQSLSTQKKSENIESQMSELRRDLQPGFAVELPQTLFRRGQALAGRQRG